MTLRRARAADLPAINALYAHYVRRSTCTMQLVPDTSAQRRRWFRAHGAKHPVWVATTDGELCGWGCLSPYAERRGYRFTVEDTVYVRRDRLGRGIGRALLAKLLDEAKRLRYHSVVGKISADQPASLALHRAFGFEEVARLPEVGFKFGRWLDVIFMQRTLRGET